MLVLRNVEVIFFPLPAIEELVRKPVDTIESCAMLIRRLLDDPLVCPDYCPVYIPQIG